MPFIKKHIRVSCTLTSFYMKAWHAFYLFLKASALSPKTNEYKSYLEYELKKGDAARIQCLYERAMKENCLIGDMWTEYTSYLVSRWLTFDGNKSREIHCFKVDIFPLLRHTTHTVEKSFPQWLVALSLAFVIIFLG